MSRWFVLIALPAALVACTGGGDDPTDPSGKDDTGLSEGPHCEATTTELTLDEVSSLGFGAQALVDLASGTHTSTMTWVDATTTDVTVVATLDGTARFVDEEPVYPTTGTWSDIGVICEDHVEVDGTLHVTTADGLLDETVQLSFRSGDGLLVEARSELDPDALTGTLVFDDFHSETDYDERSMWLSANFDADGTRGEVVGQISGTGDCDPGETCTAWAGEVAFGSWDMEVE